jgi:DNA-binding NarL/FixJ family response regulator
MGRVPPRILIVDDHPAFRRAARLLLAERGFTVIAEAGCPRAALQAAAELAPDGVLVDVHLGGECGLELARALTLGQPALAVLLVSSDPLDRRAEECGARGFVLKSELARTDLTDFWPA